MHAIVANAAPATAERLKLTEVFLSLQGEARDSGWPTVFVRLTGCPLRCQYCDTAYAFHGGEWWEMDAILAEVARHGVRHVCVTGGEPLAQKNCLPLLTMLCDANYRVSLETSGAMPLAGGDAGLLLLVSNVTPLGPRSRLQAGLIVAEVDGVPFTHGDAIVATVAPEHVRALPL